MSAEAITNGINMLGIAENNIAQQSHVRVPQFGSSCVDESASESRVLVGGFPVTNAETLDGKKSAATVDTATLNKWSHNFTVDESTYAAAKIRATFYPKFENEKPDKKDVRDRHRMIELVSEGHATLEVSLKHSGSLFLYAGHKGGAYSKNSFGNIYTAVGVFVLGRTFRQAWGTEASKKQEEFNDFLEREHMSVSMELVTAVLGDHGQRPRKDFVVVTAVTELGNEKPKFYSTLDIIAFCRKWRLPTNHVWLFSTRSSVESFFAAYDALYEEGIATTVCMALDELADISVPGSIDHVMMQGEILEGLVARIVSRVSTKQMYLVLEKYPSPVEEVNQDLGPNLREICAANRSDEKQLIKALLRSTGPAFCPDYADWFGVEAADVTPRDADKSVFNNFLQAKPSDYSTTKLKDMVRAMEKESLLADFKCYPNYHKINLISGDNLHYKMVIHVRHDETFVKYQKKMRTEPNLWPLYRGFFVEINLFKTSKEKAADIAKNSPNVEKTDGYSDDTSTKNGLADEDVNLMIKLKFLTYKLRTFLIRNGLSMLSKGNQQAYKEHYVKQMKYWNISQKKQDALTEMLDEWSTYITRKFKGRQLPSSTYLSVAEPFLEQYAKLSSQNQALIGFAGELIRTEDFLAIDEERELETKKILEPSSPTADSIQKKEGLLVFFPGIPGCGKSALCKEIINALKGLEDERTVHNLMGDRIKKKYWQIVEDELRKKPYPIVLADKNAPNIEVLMQIERMSHSTNASAVPIVPDSEGTESNPFSLDALAVFIHRVLNRDNHPGKLDKSSQNIGYVLLKFYHLYDKSRSEFESKLIERFGSLVKMPLLKSDRTPLPDSVKTKLVEGIQLYKLRRLKPNNGKWVDWEKQLCEVLHENDEYLRSIQVPFKTVVNKVLEQLKKIIKGEYVAPLSEKRKFPPKIFASVDVPIADIHNLLSNISEKDTNVKTFLESKNMENSLTKAHITLAHKGSHGVAAVAEFDQFANQNVPIDVTALLFSDKLAALEAHPGSIDGQKIDSKNEWPHLTLWTAKDIPAKEANTLPQLVWQGLATRVEIHPPFRISGVLQLH